jgi:glycerophosphoryl diester phosphodiesterase
MAAEPGTEEKDQDGAFTYRRIGHKGAAAIETGNTLASFEAAVERGVDMIELDVLRGKEGRLIVAHDPHDALSRRPLDLAEALDAFMHEPLDSVEIDCDLKLAGREAELVGALEGSGLLDRAMVSTMEIESLQKLRQIEPDLRLGWTYPKTTRDWTRYGWAAPALAAGLATMRRRFPGILRKRGPELGIDSTWVYHPIITPRLVEAAKELEIELMAWTVDDAPRIRELALMGVSGICSNDPRLFEIAERDPIPPSTESEQDEDPEKRRRFGFGRKKEPEPEAQEESG